MDGDIAELPSGPGHTDVQIIVWPQDPAEPTTDDNHAPLTGSKDAILEVDLQSLEYVTEPDPNLVCLICRTPFVQPAILAACDHCFCRECLAQAWDESATSLESCTGECPTCRAKGGVDKEGAVSRILVNMLDDLMVRCPAKRCSATVRRNEVAHHIKAYCDYTLVACAREGSHEMVERLHAGKCIHTDTVCGGCGETVRGDLMEAHQEQDCKSETPCAACGTLLLSKRLDQHLQHSCPETIAACPGALVGCRTLVKRADLMAHVNACSLATLAPFMETMTKQISGMQEQAQMTSRKLGIMEGGFRSLERLVRSSDAMVAGRGVEAQSNAQWWTSPASPVSEGSQASMPAVTPYTHLLSLHEGVRDELSRVSSALHGLEGRHSMMILNENLRLREEMAYLGGQVGGLGRQVGWLTSMRLHGGAGPMTPGAAAMGTSGAAVGVGAAAGADETERLRGIGRLARRSSDEGRVKL